MEEKILLAELTKNCEGKKEKLLKLLETYEMAELGRKIDDEREKEISNRVLAENEFFCCKEYSRDTGFKAGERITDEEFTFLLSESDFQKYLKIRRPLLVAEKLCDEKGYYITNWSSLVVSSMNALVDYIICEIVPSSMRELFSQQRRNVVFEKKLINAFKSCLKPAA